MLLEMIFSTSKAAQRSFGVTEDFLKDPRVKTLFANQGLYNGFLAAGLFWGAVFAPASYNTSIQLFFLACVIIAALFGAVTSNRGILIKQGLPAMIAIVFVLLSI
ncbi:hypothetical protein D3C73_474350 [compost metagenome]